jgi:hypothetical protein
MDQLFIHTSPVKNELLYSILHVGTEEKLPIFVFMEELMHPTKLGIF